MNIYDVSVKQHRRAVSIKEQIESLTRQLRSVFESPVDSTAAGRKKRRGLNTAARRKIATAQRLDGQSCAAEPAARSAKPTAKASKRGMSSAARATLSVKMKAYWASKKKAAKR